MHFSSQSRHAALARIGARSRVCAALDMLSTMPGFFGAGCALHEQGLSDFLQKVRARFFLSALPAGRGRN